MFLPCPLAKAKANKDPDEEEEDATLNSFEVGAHLFLLDGIGIQGLSNGRMILIWIFV